MPSDQARPSSLGTRAPAYHSATSRRKFLQTTALAGGALAANLAMPRMVHAGADDTLRIGLIGCGGRGTSAAINALNADPNSKLVALADAFADLLDISRRNLKRHGEGRADVADDRCFVGFDAYKQLIDLDEIDVVLLCTPPHFRPMHYKYAVEKGKHLFVEKPVAVDAPGYRSVVETNAAAKEKGLAVVSGLCWRYHRGMRETVARVQGGEIGDIVAIQANYNADSGAHKGRKSSWSEMEYQLRNWFFFTWLSGDHIVEQHVHSLDKAQWLMGDMPPVRASGMGGRQSRVGEQWGNIFDHHSVVFEYASGVKLYSFCRQQPNTSNDVEDYVLGTTGRARLIAHEIQGATNWKFKGRSPNYYDVEHQELFASIRAGKPLFNGDYMAASTMLAIMGRMATYTGRTITWDEAVASKLDLSPPSYEWGDLQTDPVAKPGVTPFV